MKSGSHAPVLSRLRRTKAALLAVGLTLAGIVLIMANTWIGGLELGAWHWVQSLPLGELGGTLFGAGLLGTFFEYTFRRDQAEATAEVFREIIQEQAPAMRDAVIEGFAIHPEDLERVANPALLDDIASNVMALRLGDAEFARELYTEVRDHAISSAERWYDVEVSVRLSTIVERRTEGTSLFDVTVTWEYSTTPSGNVRRFVCTSDRNEYDDLLIDRPTTSPWLMTKRPGLDARKRESYELLEFSIDGESLPIRRAERKDAQTYTVRLGDERAERGRVKVRQVFRTVTPSWGHRLFFELPQPARNMSLTMDYTNTSIVDMRVSDTVATAKPARITRTPEAAQGDVISIYAPGWLMPKSGFAFTWTLESELPRSQRSEAA